MESTIQTKFHVKSINTSRDQPLQSTTCTADNFVEVDINRLDFPFLILARLGFAQGSLRREVLPCIERSVPDVEDVWCSRCKSGYYQPEQIHVKRSTHLLIFLLFQNPPWSNTRLSNLPNQRFPQVRSSSHLSWLVFSLLPVLWSSPSMLTEFQFWFSCFRQRRIP